MRLLKSFQDLQNETCEISIDDLGNYWIGRRGSVKINVSFGMLENLYITAENVKKGFEIENTKE